MTPERLAAIKAQTQNAVLDWKLQSDDPCDLLDAQWELVQALEHAQEELAQAIAKIEEEQAESRRLVTVCAAFRHDRDALKAQVATGFTLAERDRLEADSLQALLNIVCDRAPVGYIVYLCMERGAAWVEVVDGNGCDVEMMPLVDVPVRDEVLEALAIATRHAQESAS